TLRENCIRPGIIRNLQQLSEPLRESRQAATALTAQKRRMTLVSAVGYGGLWELTQAAKAIAAKAARGELAPEDIDEATVARHMALADLPDPDLLIRTGGEQRISNFLLWSLAYTELYFCDVLWPDFGEAELEAAIEHFGRRQRRFGLAPSQVEVR